MVLTLLLSACSSISCKPDFVVNEWHAPNGAPTAIIGQSGVRTALDNFESVTFISCKYND